MENIPTYHSFGYFIHDVLQPSVEELFCDLNRKIFAEEHVDLNHLYIDGSKFEANANKYQWVWKKATEKSRYRFSAKITALFEEINVELTPSGIAIPTNTEYVPEYLTEVLKQYTAFWKLDEADFVHRRGHHKSPQQQHYERLQEYTNKLKEYNPYRAVNFHIDETGTLRCPNKRAFRFFYRQHVRGNHFGRQEEVYQCEDCTGCPYAPDCKRTDGNRTVRMNRELTAMHQEVVENLNSIQGALLRMNRSIQAEGTFGILKTDRWYRKIVRRGSIAVRTEIFLVSIGHNLYKYYNKKQKMRQAA